MKLTIEQRRSIARRMKGNRNAVGYRSPRYVYRPRIYRNSHIAAMIETNTFPLEVDWHRSGYLGINTNDPERVAAWAAKATKLGYIVRDTQPRKTGRPTPTTKQRLTPRVDLLDIATEPWDVDEPEPWDTPER